MKKQLLLLLLVWALIGTTTPTITLAETQNFALSEKVTAGQYQQAEEVRLWLQLRIGRLLNEQAGQYLAQLPQLKAFKPNQLKALAVALFKTEHFELDNGKEIKAKLMLDTSLIPEDIPLYLQKNLYMLESIENHQARNLQLETDLGLYLQDLSRANGAEHAQYLRQTRGQKLLNQYKGNQAFVEAANLFGRSRWQDAINKLSQALSLDPDYVGSYFLRAIGYFQLKKYDQALADLNKGIGLAPDNEGLYFFRGLTYYVQGALLHRALADLNKTIEIAPHNAQAYYLRGAVYRSQGQCDRAKRDFTQACSMGLSEACPKDCTPTTTEEYY
jgi:tetratricopeptide (TPR) repeat protein